MKESFAYGLTDVGNITKITDGDGVNWNYTYDVNNRLASASRKNAATPTITASYTYTYDDAGNLVTKVQPFLDDFQDGNLTGWSASGSMSASGGYAANTTTTGWSKIYRSVTDADGEISFSYMLEAGGRAQVALRKATDSIQLLFWAGSAQMREWVSGGWGTTLDQDAAVDSTDDVWYDVRLVMDGADIKVWRAERGVENQELILETTAASVTTGSSVEFQIPTSAQNRYDNIQLRIGGLTSTQTYAYNTANEMTKGAYEGVTTNFSYDDWGNQISKYVSGGPSAAYTYGEGQKMVKVASTFPGEGTVDYEYGGDGKRRRRTVTGGTDTWYTWDAGYNVLSEYNISGITYGTDYPTGDGTLTTTYIPGLAQIAGTNPATGTYSYYFKDHLESTRALYDQSKNQVASFEYTAYGANYAASGSVDTTRRFTGHDWDSTSQLYFAPYRYYSPNAARWTQRDPLGMVDGPNVYAYVSGDPVNHTDPFGLSRVVCVSPNRFGLCPWGYRDVSYRDACGKKQCCKYIKPSKCDKCWSKAAKQWRKCEGSKPCQDNVTAKLISCLQKNGCAGLPKPPKAK